MDFATKFALNLKSYFDTVPTNVWYDFETNFLSNRTWDEDCILRTSILRNGFDNLTHLNEANRNPIYQLKVKSHDYGGRGEETITGADLAIIFRLKVNNDVVSQRIVLVQLKRAYFSGKEAKFSALHDSESGKRYYGKGFHQAQKMLFFSTTPVYWFAMTSAILEDHNSLSSYSKKSNISQISDFKSESVVDSRNYCFRHLEEYLYYEEYLNHHKDRGSNSLKIDHLKKNLPYQFWQLLRNRLGQHEYNNFGMPQRIGLFVCNAEDVYALSHKKSDNNKFTDLYSKSIPFTQFMLGNILRHEFGDANKKLIDAVINQDVKGYFRNRVQQIADSYDFDVPDNFEELFPVHHSIIMDLGVSSTTDETEQ